MKEIRCSFTGHFYIEIEDDADPDKIEDAIGKYISAMEELINDYAGIDEFDWWNIKND